jgi:Uma2 family endonuclease
MSVALRQALPQPHRAVRTIYRFTVEQYHRMTETGILTDNDRVELLEGLIVDKMPRNPPHDAAITRINRRLLRVLPEDWLLRVQSAVALRDSEPEPDFAIVPGPEEAYDKRHPSPRDIALIVEVADSTLLADRRDKGSLYARARIPEYWIVNISEAKVEVYTRPRGGKTPGYVQGRDYGPDGSVLLVLGGDEIDRIAVKDLLPRAGHSP